MNRLHKRLMALALPLVLVAQPALAQDGTDDDVQVTGNAAVVSDYLFRGLSQTWGHPALQGGMDITAGRWNVGTSASNVSHNSYPGGGVELDVYGDAGLFRRGDWSARLGLYGYLYPGANLDQARPSLASRSFNTLEANLSLSWKNWTFKYSHALTDYFGADVEQGYANDTHGSNYLQLDGDVALSPRWNLHLHAGRTHFTSVLAAPLPGGARDPDYADYSVAVSYTISPHWSLGATLSHATNDAFYGNVTSFRNPTNNQNLGGTRGLLNLSANF